MRWLIGFLGVAAVIAVVREVRIRSLEQQHDPDRTSSAGDETNAARLGSDRHGSVR